MLFVYDFIELLLPKTTSSTLKHKNTHKQARIQLPIFKTSFRKNKSNRSQIIYPFVRFFGGDQDKNEEKPVFPYSFSAGVYCHVFFLCPLISPVSFNSVFSSLPFPVFTCYPVLFTRLTTSLLIYNSSWHLSSYLRLIIFLLFPLFQGLFLFEVLT